jgi:hypothetical protein
VLLSLQQLLLLLLRSMRVEVEASRMLQLLNTND